MINYDTPGLAFPRLAKPPVPPIRRDNIHDLNHYHNNLNNLPGLGGSHPRDHISPIAHAIASQILSSHLNRPQIGIGHAVDNGIQDALMRVRRPMQGPNYQAPFGFNDAGSQPLLNGLPGLGGMPSPAGQYGGIF